VNVPQICTTSGFTPQLRWLLKFPSCFSYHSSFWFASTHQSASKINYLSSPSFTLFWHLWFKLLLQWAISCLVPLIQKQQQLHLPQFLIYLWVFSVATWLTWPPLKENGLSKLLNGYNGFPQSDIASMVLCSHNGEMVQMENQCSTISTNMELLHSMKLIKLFQHSEQTSHMEVVLEDLLAFGFSLELPQL